MSTNILIMILVFAVAVLGGKVLYDFTILPVDDQIEEVKQWLLYAVTIAEKELGGGVGQIKLRFVYDMFIQKFPELVTIIKFDTFSSLVDEVLVQFKEIMATNNKLKNFVEK